MDNDADSTPYGLVRSDRDCFSSGPIIRYLFLSLDGVAPPPHGVVTIGRFPMELIAKSI
jgi:hypothetical protein